LEENKWRKRPGSCTKKEISGISPHHTHQTIEIEAMQEDEYNSFLGDFFDFTLRLYLPRISGAIEPFSMLPKLTSSGYNYRGALVLAEVSSYQPESP
jgi:hypothetical protein